MIRSKSLAGLLLALTACGGGDIQEPESPPVPAKLVIISARELNGVLDEYLSTQLAVRVTDLLDHGVPRVAVTWTPVGGGPGNFPVTNLSDTTGLALLAFRPARVGTIQVIASIGRSANPSVVFTITVRPDAPKVVIHFGPMFDCYPTPNPYDPSLFDDPGPVPIGMTVQWIYANYVPTCTARIESTTVPPGGEPFDSGIIGAGQSFSFVPQVAGDWQYRDVINGGEAILRVR